MTASPEQISAAERLIRLLTPTEAAAAEQLAAWRNALREADELSSRLGS